MTGLLSSGWSSIFSSCLLSPSRSSSHTATESSRRGGAVLPKNPRHTNGSLGPDGYSCKLLKSLAAWPRGRLGLLRPLRVDKCRLLSWAFWSLSLFAGDASKCCPTFLTTVGQVHLIEGFVHPVCLVLLVCLVVGLYSCFFDPLAVLCSPSDWRYHRCQRPFVLTFHHVA
jgi:hypothetical protein